MERSGTWLCPTEADRERLVDMSARVRKARTITAVAMGSALVVSVPWIGPWPLALLVLVGANLAIIEGKMATTKRPEYVAAASMAFLQCVIAGGILMTGGPESPVVAWIVAPTAIAAARFRRHVCFAFAAVAILMMLVCMVAVDPAAFAGNPVPFFATLALLASIVATTMALMNAEIEHREDAVIDPLTGLLNRKALATRFQEIEQQARQSEASVCVIAVDLDHFKVVNDTHGHPRGDDVLRDVTYELRKGLRTFELMYRVGGEEFLIVLPGADLAEGLAVGERLRQAVADTRPGGLRVTISLGVAAASGADVRYDALAAAADRALYRAKEAGRNRVDADGRDDLAPQLDASGVALA